MSGSALQTDHAAPSAWAAAAVALCGVCAFLGVYCTQPLLPLLTRVFHSSKTGVGWTVSAATLGVALSAPVFGALTERLGRKRVIVASLVGAAGGSGGGSSGASSSSSSSSSAASSGDGHH